MLPRLPSFGTNIPHANETLYGKLTIEISHLSLIPPLEKSKNTLDKVKMFVFFVWISQKPLNHNLLLAKLSKLQCSYSKNWRQPF